jgi:hypothetical protein
LSDTIQRFNNMKRSLTINALRWIDKFGNCRILDRSVVDFFESLFWWAEDHLSFLSANI